MKQFDVVALGELLIDFTESGLSPQGNPFWRSIRAAHPAMYYQSWPNLAGRRPSSARSVMTCSDTASRRQFHRLVSISGI